MSISHTRRGFLHCTAALCCGLFIQPAQASDGRALLGFATSPDNALVFDSILGALQPLYRPDLGAHPVLIPGNAGMLAVAALKKAPRDGSTVLISPSSLMTLAPDLRDGPDAPNAPVPVAAFGELTHAFVVGPAVPKSVVTMQDYLSWVRANPERSGYGTIGVGTGSHFIGAEVARKADLPLKPAAYKSVPAQMGDVAGGNVPAAIMIVGDALALAGTTRMLAVSSDRRWPAIPDVPTLIELGLADSPVVESIGFFVPAGTSSQRIAELGHAISSAATTPPVQQALRQAALRPPSTTYENYASSLVQERREWQAIVKRNRFSVRE